MNAPLLVLFSLASVLAPIAGTAFIWWAISFVSPYSRSGPFRRIGWSSTSSTDRFLSLSITPWVFAFTGMTAAGSALVLELSVHALFTFLGTGSETTLFSLAVLAGPIEEAMKWAVSVCLYIALGVLILGPASSRNKVKDGMLVGLFVGCSFGLLESVGYLVLGFSLLLDEGIRFATLDPIVWRLTLGVLIHGMYTALACIGLGRGKKAVLWTMAGLALATVLHSLNNGIQGYVFILRGLEGNGYAIMVDVLQFGLMMIGALFLLAIWHMSDREGPMPG